MVVADVRSRPPARPLRRVYILDNLTKAVLPQERIKHYVPYYSINESTRWARAAGRHPGVVAIGRMTPSAEAE